MNPLEREQVESKQGTVKKVYNRPQLEIYGKLREITKSTSFNVTHRTDSLGCDPVNERCFTGA